MPKMIVMYRCNYCKNCYNNEKVAILCEKKCFLNKVANEMFSNGKTLGEIYNRLYVRDSIYIPYKLPKEYSHINIFTYCNIPHLQSNYDITYRISKISDITHGKVIVRCNSSINNCNTEIRIDDLIPIIRR